MMHNIELSDLICVMNIWLFHFWYMILIQAYLTSILNRLEATDNGQNILSETMEISGQSQVHNTTFEQWKSTNHLFF